MVRNVIVLCIGKSSKAGETALSTNSPTNLIPLKKVNKLSNNYVFFNEQRCELFDREKTLFEKHCVHLGICFSQEMVEWTSHCGRRAYSTIATGVLNACLTEGQENAQIDAALFMKGLPVLTFIVQIYRMSKTKVQNIDQQQGPLQIFSNHRRWGRLYIPYLLLTVSIRYSLLNFETI